MDEKQHLPTFSPDIDICKLQEIAVGHHSVVYKAKVQDIVCCVKVLKLTTMLPKAQKEAHQEVALMQKISSQNIVSLLGSFERDGSLFMFLELFQTDLKKTIIQKKNSASLFSPPELVTVGVSVANALDYLHELRIMHRDVKSLNILLDMSAPSVIDRVVLADLGTCIEMTGTPISDYIGTCRWMAPEVHLAQPYGPGVDVWSFGMVLIEMLSLGLPYASILVLDLPPHIMKGVLPPELKSLEASLFVSLIEWCLKFSPDERPTPKQLIEHLNKTI